MQKAVADLQRDMTDVKAGHLRLVAGRSHFHQLRQQFLVQPDTGLSVCRSGRVSAN